MRQERRIRWAAVVAALLAAGTVGAQNPTRLPEVKVNADAAGSIVGIVTDTSGIPIADAQVMIPKLRRLILSGPDGSFRFDTVPPGKYDVRARKLGYAPQIEQIKTDKAGGRLDNFELVPIDHLLPTVVATVGRLGLSGIVADTALVGVPGADVKVLGVGMDAVTDSVGAFYVPVVKPGNYMASVSKDGYEARVVGFSIPTDSGRRVTVSLGPPVPHSHREAWNIKGLTQTIAWAQPGSHFMYGHDYMVRKGFVWVQEEIADAAQNFGLSDPPDADCYATVNGGPTIISIRDVTVDEVESVQIMGQSRVRGAAASRPGGPTGGGSRPAAMMPMGSMTNTERMSGANRGKRCLAVGIWTR
jgi:hypothetical protein